MRIFPSSVMIVWLSKMWSNNPNGLGMVNRSFLAATDGLQHCSKTRVSPEVTMIGFASKGPKARES
jgi:hypothetical protein